MRERSAGHWELRAFTGNDPATGRPTRATETFIGTEKGAGKALSALVAKVNAGKFNRSTATIGHLLDKWLEATESHQRPRTVYENKRKVEARIRPKLGSVRLSRLGADTLDAAYRQWLDEGLSAATVHKYGPGHATLGHAQGNGGAHAGPALQARQGGTRYRSGDRLRHGTCCAHGCPKR
jgi:hypothetical protein